MSEGAADLLVQTELVRRDFRLQLDLRLPGTGITALFGASGSGKTSALRVIAGLEAGARGRVQIGDACWQDSGRSHFLPTHQRAVGYVFQEACLFDHLSVEDNLKFGFQRTPPAQRQRSWPQVLDLLDLLGIGPLLKRWPQGLSGGERQRVALARALAASPRLLLMDEPLAALDAARKAEILPYLERINTELALPMIYVSHAVDEVARLADHLVLLQAGQVQAQGPTADLLTAVDLPLAHGDAAGAVLSCKVVQHDDADHLTLTQFEGGQLTVPRHSAPVGSTVRVRVQARDVSLTLTQQTGTSIQNILPATVLNVGPEGPGQVMVLLQVGQQRLLARLTQRSARVLGLQVGRPVWAQIKGVAILG
jgi:molybdate transport system ATP-binding protein